MNEQSLERNLENTSVTTQVESNSVSSPEVLPKELRTRVIADFDNHSIQNKGRDNRQVESIHSEKMANAKILIENHEYELAINILVHVLTENPNDLLAAKWLAKSFNILGCPEKAIRHLEPLSQAYGDHELRTHLAESKYLQGDMQWAEKDYLQLSEENIEDENLLFHIFKNLGNIYIKSGNITLAEEFYNKAYTINPDSDILLVNHGTLEIQKEDFNKARDCYRRAIEINQYNDKAWVGLALVYRHFGDIELSWANIENAFDCNPYNETALQLTVDWSFKDGKESYLVNLLEELNKESNSFSKRFIRAKLLYSLSRSKQALEQVNKIKECFGSSRDVDSLENLILKQIKDLGAE